MGTTGMKKFLSVLIAAIMSVVALFAFSGCGGKDSATDEPGPGPGPVDPPEQKPVAEHNFYSNPIYPLHKGEKQPLYTADPYVIRDDDGTYYMYCTQTDVFDREDMDRKVFKRGPIFKSIDCVNWTYEGDVFDGYTLGEGVLNWGLAQNMSNSPGVWAPTVLKVGDYYNYYYSLSWGGGWEDGRIGIGVARAQSPSGPFEHYGKVFTSEEIGVKNSIDPHVLYDNGRLYMVFGSYGGLITLVELESDGLSLKGGVATQREQKVALAGYEMYEMTNYEASFIYKKNGKYWLFLSTGTTLSGKQSTYNVVVASAESITGPYKDSKGKTMFGPRRGDSVITPSMTGAMGTGHMCIVEDDQGESWMFYHGYDTTSQRDYRALYIDKIIWDDETGLPHVNKYHATNQTQTAGPYINALERAGGEQ